jgi:hypothetical protein
MLLQYDGKVDQWIEETVTEDGDLVVSVADIGQFETSDVGKRLAKAHGVLDGVVCDDEGFDCSDIGVESAGMSACGDKPQRQPGWTDLRNALVTHFTQAREKKLVRWLRNKIKPI